MIGWEFLHQEREKFTKLKVHFYTYMFFKFVFVQIKQYRTMIFRHKKLSLVYTNIFKLSFDLIEIKKIQ
jgi:hypothetical protein